MDKIAVSSSTIRAVGYEEPTQTLEVEFKAGSTYQYASVPKAVYQRFMVAPSKGKFLAQFIKEKYKTTKIR